MTIRDRGILKWQAALILPEQKAFQINMNKDYFRQVKPILDEYQLEMFLEPSSTIGRDC
ncbi:hypothetical protein J7E52_20955 [Bacillus sp. ISL-34]|uniref:hypothetical protein n=1 Tax=Bacillus sp. ISL-34 TaxID=2819121 RepID=UPI001BE79D37|nr:hypothetical protein [Bacillus sp. ISL-34]MBT2649145.1 hypothetical protein [Bacillus sp. ISL-34]